MRRYLQLTRSHTVPLEAAPAAVGALLATGGTVTLGMVYWTIFGVLYHLAGYGHNSYSDWKNGHDKEDPHKQHHPLNDGRLSGDTAKDVVLLLLGITLTWAVAGAFIFDAPSVLLVGAAMLLFGVIYNEIGKETEMKFLFITAAHSSVFVIPYLALGGTVDSVFLFLLSVVALWVIYQISVSGEVKDITTNEENFLKTLGVEAKGDIVVPSKVATLYSVALRLMIGTVALMPVVMKDRVTTAYVIVVITSLSAVLSFIMMNTNIWSRDKALKNMSTLEMASMAIFLLAASPYIGVVTAVGIFVISGLWVVAFNKYTWGTTLAPKV